METNDQALQRHNMLQDLRDGLLGYADPVPTQDEWQEGIPHMNDNPRNFGHLWDVVRAFQSRKMHYYTRIRDDMLKDSKLNIWAAFPDLSPASGGTDRLSEGQWQSLKKHFGLQTKAD